MTSITVREQCLFVTHYSQLMYINFMSEVLVWCYTFWYRGVEDINKQDMAQQRLAHMLSL